MRRTLPIALLALLTVTLAACSGELDLVSVPTATPTLTEMPPTATPTFIPSVTPLPTATATPLPTATPQELTATPAEDGQASEPADAATVPGGEVVDAAIDKLERIYITTFDDGWPTLEDEQSKLYVDGGLLVFELGLNTRRYLETTVIDEADIVAEVEATPSTCPEGGGYGMFFRLSDENNYYALTIFCDGRVAVYARVDGALSDPLLEATLPDGIDAAAGSHLIRLGALGEQFTVHMDGQFVGSFGSDLLDSGDVALYASTTGGGTLRVAFDNLGVWTAIGSE